MKENLIEPPTRESVSLILENLEPQKLKMASNFAPLNFASLIVLKVIRLTHVNND